MVFIAEVLTTTDWNRKCAIDKICVTRFATDQCVFSGGFIGFYTVAATSIITIRVMDIGIC